MDLLLTFFKSHHLYSYLKPYALLGRKLKIHLWELYSIVNTYVLILNSCVTENLNPTLKTSCNNLQLSIFGDIFGISVKCWRDFTPKFRARTNFQHSHTQVTQLWIFRNQYLLNRFRAMPDKWHLKNNNIEIISWIYTPEATSSLGFIFTVLSRRN